MNFSFTFGIFEFFFEDDRDYIPLDGDSLVGIRIQDLHGRLFVPKKENKLTDFIAFCCGDKKRSWSNGYYFCSHRAGQHFINLVDGFDNPLSKDEENTAPPPWAKKDEFDDDDLPW